MHDPKTVAFDLHPIVTIWHNDPEKDGTDDSCGFFMRSRHGDPEVLKKIKSAIGFSFDRTFESSGKIYNMGYFFPDGTPNFSVHGIVLNMFQDAAWVFFEHSRRKYNRWIRRNICDILLFAENPTDSMRDSIVGTFSSGEKWDREESLTRYTHIIYGWILRSNRKWYQHPKWHIHHWSLQIHPLQNVKRRYWDKCCKCGRRGFKGSAMGNWTGDKIWHQYCDDTKKQPSVKDTNG